MADYNNLKKILQGAVDRKQKAQMDTRSKDLMGTIGQDLVSSLTPVLSQLASQSTGNRQDMITEFKSALNEALKEIKVDNKVEVPPIDTSELAEAVADAIRGIKITPQINVSSPEIRMPNIPAPIVNIPDLMKVMGEVSMPGYDYKNPLPVMMMDRDGKPFQFSMGASGGKGDFFTIKGFAESAFSVPINSDGEVKVAGTFTAGAVTSAYVIVGNSEMLPYNGDNPMPVTITSGASATTATNIVDSSGVAYSGSNPVPVVITSGASATTAVQNLNADGTYRDTFPVQGTVLVSDITASVKTALVDSSGVQYSGSNPVPISDAGGTLTVDGTVAVSGLTGSIGATILNGEGLARDSWLVSGITNTVATANVDSSGIQYSGSNPFPFSLVTNATSTVNVVNVDSTGIYRSTFPVSGTVAVSGLTGSIVVIGEIVSDAADTGNAPIKIGGIARTANPTAVAGGDRVSASMDDLGRQIMRPVQVRDLMATAYVAVSTGTETTFLAASAGVYHDLIYVLASNDSTAAIGMDIRGTTGGNILMHLEIPANSTTGLSLPVPMMGALTDQSGNNWTVDLPDITGTTVYVSGLFTKEI